MATAIKDTSPNGNGKSKPKTRKERDDQTPDIDLDDPAARDFIIRATLYDPNRWNVGTGPGVEKQTTLSYRAQRQMFHNCAVLAGIRNTRLSQIAAFTERARPGDEGKPGWKVCLKDEEKEPTARDLNRIKEVESFFEKMYRAGLPQQVEKRLRPGKDYPAEGFDGFVRAIMNDSIEIDAIAFEKVRTRDGKLLTVQHIDAGTINRFLPKPSLSEWGSPLPNAPALEDVLSDSLKWLADRDDSDGEAAYVQVIDGMGRSYFGQRDLAYRYRNVRTDIEHAGFGYSEAEQLVSIVSALLNAETYNSKNFTNGHLPEGLLHFSGSSYDKGDLDSMRRDFEATGMGVENAHRMAILVSRNKEAVAQWIAFRMSNRDMEYGAFVKLLVDLAHAVFQISPRETGLGEGFGQPAPLSERNPSAEIEHSVDKGLLPLLAFLAKVLTTEIVAEFYDDLEFRFAGVSHDDEAFKLQEETQRLTNGTLLPDEVRARRDEDPMPDGLGTIPVNGLLFQVWQQREQQKQQEKMAGEPPPKGSPDRMNYFRAPLDDEEQAAVGQGQGDEGAEGQNQDPEQEGDTSTMQKSLDAALAMARSYALLGWRANE